MTQRTEQRTLQPPRQAWESISGPKRQVTSRSAQREDGREARKSSLRLTDVQSDGKVTPCFRCTTAVNETQKEKGPERSRQDPSEGDLFVNQTQAESGIGEPQGLPLAHGQRSCLKGSVFPPLEWQEVKAPMAQSPESPQDAQERGRKTDPPACRPLPSTHPGNVSHESTGSGAAWGLRAEVSTVNVKNGNSLNAE